MQSAVADCAMPGMPGNRVKTVPFLFAGMFFAKASPIVVQRWVASTVAFGSLGRTSQRLIPELSFLRIIIRAGS